LAKLELFHQFIFLFFNGLMESKISEANTHPPAGGFGCCDDCLMGISLFIIFVRLKMDQRQFRNSVALILIQCTHLQRYNNSVAKMKAA
jgi:hypothetical protein